MKLLNSSIEVALRILILLDELNKEIDLQKLIFLDYALLHACDFDINQKNLVPASPFRKEELSIKSELLKNALKILCEKQLIDVVFNSNGIVYKNNELSKLFLKKISSEYAIEIKEQAKWVKKHFRKYFEYQKMKQYFDCTLDKWESEFSVYGLYSEDYANAK